MKLMNELIQAYNGVIITITIKWLQLGKFTPKVVQSSHFEFEWAISNLELCNFYFFKCDAYEILGAFTKL